MTGALIAARLRPEIKLATAAQWVGEGIEPFDGKLTLPADAQTQLQAALDAAHTSYPQDAEQRWLQFIASAEPVIEQLHTQAEAQHAAAAAAATPEPLARYGNSPRLGINHTAEGKQAAEKLCAIWSQFVADHHLSARAVADAWTAQSGEPRVVTNLLTNLKTNGTISGLFTHIDRTRDAFFDRLEADNGITISPATRTEVLTDIDEVIHQRRILNAISHRGRPPGFLSEPAGGGSEQTQALYSQWSDFTRTFQLSREAVVSTWSQCDGKPHEIERPTRLLNKKGFVGALFKYIAANPERYFDQLQSDHGIIVPDEMRATLVATIDAAIATNARAL